MIEVCLRNGQVQQNWSAISKDVINPETSNNSSKEIITLWITVRGNSLAATWLELYKKRTKKTQKRARDEENANFEDCVASIIYYNAYIVHTIFITTIMCALTAYDEE